MSARVVCSLFLRTSVWVQQDFSLESAWRRLPEACRSVPEQDVIISFDVIRAHASIRYFFIFWVNWRCSIINELVMTDQTIIIKKWTLTWSWLTWSCRAWWDFAAICETCCSFVEQCCFRPSISSAQYLCLSSNSWQVSASFSSKLTCWKVQVSEVYVNVSIEFFFLFLVSFAMLQFNTCSSCSSVSLSSSLCSRCSISDSSVVMGVRIPPVVSETVLGSSADSGEPEFSLALEAKTLLFQQAP